jgi:hypothetical protein
LNESVTAPIPASTSLGASASATALSAMIEGDNFKDVLASDLLPRLVRVLVTRSERTKKPPFDGLAKLLRSVSILRSTGNITSSDLQDALDDLLIQLTGPQCSHLLTLVEDHSPEGIINHFKEFHDRQGAALQRPKKSVSVAKLPTSAVTANEAKMQVFQYIIVTKISMFKLTVFCFCQAEVSSARQSVSKPKLRPESAPLERTQPNVEGVGSVAAGGSGSELPINSPALVPRPPSVQKAAFGSAPSSVDWDKAPLPLFWVRAKHIETGQVGWRILD